MACFLCDLRSAFFVRRSIPMSIFSLAAIGGTGLGAVMAGWVEMNPHLGWRWIQWIQMMYESVDPIHRFC